MNNFSFFAPTYFSFGRDSEQHTGELVKRFGGTRVLLHYGTGSIKNNGVYDRVVASLKEANIPWIELDGALPNPRSGLVYRGIELCRQEGIDFVLAVGGGSAIDSAKAIAAGAVYEGDFWDFYGTGKPIEKALPLGTVLTIAAAGSEGSPDSVITHEDGMLKRAASGEALRPRFSILNPATTCGLSPFQTACGITDIMAHVCERYFTNTADVQATDFLCEAILQTLISEAPKVIAKPDDYQARANIMWAGMLAHNNVCGVGREQDWSSHDIEHELSARYDVAHGAGLSVIMPAWMRYVMKHDVHRFARFAVRVWACEPDQEHPERVAAEGITRFRSFLDSIGMPATFAELGAKAEDIPALVATLGVSDTRTVGSFVKLNARAVEAIYRLALSR